MENSPPRPQHASAAAHTPSSFSRGFRVLSHQTGGRHPPAHFATLVFFQCVNDRGRTNFQHPCRIADTAAIETHVHDLLFDRRGTSFVEEIQLKAIMRTGGVLALIALLTRFGLAAFDDLVAATVGTQHGNEYHDTLLLNPSAAWHTWGESANLKHDRFGDAW